MMMVASRGMADAEGTRELRAGLRGQPATRQPGRHRRRVLMGVCMDHVISPRQIGAISGNTEVPGNRGLGRARAKQGSQDVLWLRMSCLCVSMTLSSERLRDVRAALTRRRGQSRTVRGEPRACPEAIAITGGRIKSHREAPSPFAQTLALSSSSSLSSTASQRSVSSPSPQPSTTLTAAPTSASSDIGTSRCACTASAARHINPTNSSISSLPFSFTN